MGTNFTFEDFLQRLERSPVTHMQPLYHDNRQLFIHRPDMLQKAIMGISWERGLSLLRAAYYTQPMSPPLYRALLARMVLHNRHVRRAGAGALVPWSVALLVYHEAMGSFGASTPSQLGVSALRLLAPHRQWSAAMGVLQTSQANGLLTRPMLLEAAQACATPRAWATALQLLARLHSDDPELLPDSIQALRPPGTDALTAQEQQHALLPGGAAAAMTPERRHVVEVLGSVVSQVPPAVALQHPLCHSFLTHLVASTSLSVTERTQRLSVALQGFPWGETVRLLSVYSEPNLLSEAEWKQLPPPPQANPTKEKKKRKTSRKKGHHDHPDTKVAPLVNSHSSSAAEDSEEATEEAEGGGELVNGAPTAADPALATFTTLQKSTQWLLSTPATAAAMTAVMVDKLPTVQDAVAFLRLVAAHQRSVEDSPAAPASGGEALRLAPPASSAVSLARQPAVTAALLRKCAADGETDGWREAVPLLLSLPTSSTQNTEVLSSIVLQLRRARRPSLAVRLLSAHIIPSHGRLTPAALEAMYECILAHNRALALRRGPGERDGAPAVHWLSALSWHRELLAPARQPRVVKTGTGPSGGAVAVRAAVETVEAAPPPVSAKMLSILVHLCVLGGSADGALRAVAAARDADKTALAHAEEVKAMLYCMKYDRPLEAAAILAQSRKRHGEASTAALSQLFDTIRLSKESAAALQEK